MIDILKSKKISETPFRLRVLSIFSKYSHAISLKTLEQELHDYNRITLYRTIKKFIKEGVIHEISISGVEPTYAICKDECNVEAHHHQHIHFKCTNCSTIFCVEIDNFPSISIPHYQINQLEIQASGLCQSCM